MAKAFRQDIAVLRLVSIVVVVFFHAYGMMYASHFSPETQALYYGKYEWFNQYYPINIAMPLFVFISGLLFGGQMLRRPEMGLKEMVMKKFQRLVVPFFVFTVIFMFAINDLKVTPFYTWSYWHLWYLPRLFWCFIIAFFLRSLLLHKKFGVGVATVVALFALSFVDLGIPPVLGVQGVNRWLCWFAIGVWFCQYEKSILTNEKRKWLIIGGGIVSYLIMAWLFPVEYGETSLAYVTATLMAIAALWAAASLVPWHKLSITPLLLNISACSFGIYIFHNWVEVYLISSTAQRLFSLEPLAHDHTILFPLAFSSLAFAISYFLSRLLLRAKVGRYLIG